MGSRQRPLDRARERSRVLVRAVGADIRAARVQHGLTLADIGRPAGISAAQVSRIERGLVGQLDMEAAAVLAAAVGLELALRTFPAGDPLRDTAHLALLERFRRRLHPAIRWRTEVPLPLAGDLRAWDALVTLDGRPLGVEAETRPRDLQALERRLALKMRDGGVDTVVLVLADTRSNRRLLREHGPRLAGAFPVPGPRALQLLATSTHPGRSAIVLL